MRMLPLCNLCKVFKLCNVSGSGMLGPMLSPIQQLENFEESEIQLDPQELLPIMEVGLLMYFFKSGGKWS